MLAYIAFTHVSPNPNGSRWNLEYEWRMVCTPTKIRENCPEVSFKYAKTCFVFMSQIQRGLSATYPAPIMIIFEIKTWIGVRMRKPFKFPNFCAGVLQVPKTTENWYFRGVFAFVIEVQLKRHNFGKCESFRD